MKALIVLLATLPIFGHAQEKPLRIGVAGLTHGHVHWILGAAQRGEVQIVGVAEPNVALTERLLQQYSLPLSLHYTTLTEMLTRARPEAVTAFGSIYDHLAVVQACAPRKIHVMVEKPLAVTLGHARQMEELAKQHGILLLTNYETTWYGSHPVAREMVDRGSIGHMVKIVVHDGHQGPKEIGVNNEFLEWLTDPRLNGGGAIMDFGCYGANLATWLMKGQRPVSVSAITQQIKPDIYPKVDDEATIVLTYPKAQAIIQASWNWPYNRKDIEIYGTSGYIFADKQGIRFMTDRKEGELSRQIDPRPAPYHDPFAFLTAVVRGTIELSPDDLSSLNVNMVVLEILEAAKESASTGKVVYLKRTAE